MTEHNPTLFLASGSHTAAAFRRLTATNAFDAEGVVGAADLRVAQRAAGAGMSVDVAGGRAFVKGTEAEFAGTYFVENEGLTNLRVPTANVANGRVDVVAARVRDAAYSGTESEWDLHYIEGTPSANPVVPDTDFSSLILAEITVAAGATTITNSVIVDRRVRVHAGVIESFMVATIDGSKITGNVTSASAALMANTAATATTADRLAVGRTLTFTGDMTGAGTFDGSANVNIALDADLEADDIPDLAASKITSGVLDAARLPSVTIAVGPVEATTITGSGDVNIDSGVLFVDASLNRVGINTVTPGEALAVAGDFYVRDDARLASDLRVDDGLTVDGTTLVVDATASMVGIGTATPTSTLDVSGGLAVSAGADIGGALLVSGVIGATALTVSGNFSIGGSRLNVDQTSGRVGIGTAAPAHLLDIAGTVGVGDDLTVTGDLTVGGTDLVVNSTSNQVGVGRTPDRALDVRGTFRTSGNAEVGGTLTVAGALSASIAADQISSGTLAAGRVPNLSASKITSGTLNAGRIPDLAASKITSGIIDAARLPPAVTASETATNLSGGTVDATTITGSGNVNIDSGVLFVDSTLNRVGINTATPGEALAVVGDFYVQDNAWFRTTFQADGLVTLRGGLIVEGDFTADIGAESISSGTLASARIPDLEAGKVVSGTFAAARIPDLAAGKITSGTFPAGRIPNLPASRINSGTLAAARVPDLAADKIVSGTLGADRVPGLDASKLISGTIDEDRLPAGIGTGGTAGPSIWPNRRTLTVSGDMTGSVGFTGAADIALTLTAALEAADIPDLNAAKISAGTFSTDRIPQLAAQKIGSGVFAGTRIPNLNASKITAGTLDTDRIPNVDASKVTSGTLGAARIPNLAASKITSGIIDAARLPPAAAASDTAVNLDGGTVNATTITGSGNLAIDGDTLFVNADLNRVGINTVTPGEALSVVGDFYVSSTAWLNNTLRVTGAATFNDDMTVVGDTSLAGATVSGDLTVAATTLVATGGNVGIGTATPGETLSVAGTFFASGDASINGVMRVGAGSTLRVDPGLTRVGINTATPAYTFDVNGSMRTFGTLRSDGNLIVSGTTSMGIINSASSVQLTGDVVVGNLRVTGTKDFGGIDAGEITTGTISANRLPATSGGHTGGPLTATTITGTGDMRVAQAGDTTAPLFVDVSLSRVGINDDTPEHTLDVNGTMAVRGAAFFSGATGLAATNISGNLAVDTDTLHVNVQTDRIGINTATPAYTLDVKGSIRATQTAQFDALTRIKQLGINRAARTGNALDVTGRTRIDGDVLIDGADASLSFQDNRQGIHLSGATSFINMSSANGNIIIRGNRVPQIFVQAAAPPASAAKAGDLWIDT